MFNLSFNHVGLTVGDLDAAVSFYGLALGMTVLVGPTEVNVPTPGLRDVFGTEWRAMRIAHLEVVPGVGLELFEFVEPATESAADTFEYWRTGVSHLGLTVSNLEDARRRIADAGGQARTAIHEPWPGRRICYCEDPWGTQLELTESTYRALAGV